MFYHCGRCNEYSQVFWYKDMRCFSREMTQSAGLQQHFGLLRENKNGRSIPLTRVVRHTLEPVHGEHGSAVDI